MRLAASPLPPRKRDAPGSCNQHHLGIGTRAGTNVRSSQTHWLVCELCTILQRPEDSTLESPAQNRRSSACRRCRTVNMSIRCLVFRLCMSLSARNRILQAGSSAYTNLHPRRAEPAGDTYGMSSLRSRTKDRASKGMSHRRADSDRSLPRQFRCCPGWHQMGTCRRSPRFRTPGIR
jgi:hypothetical protein